MPLELCRETHADWLHRTSDILSISNSSFKEELQVGHVILNRVLVSIMLECDAATMQTAAAKLTFLRSPSTTAA